MKKFLSLFTAFVICFCALSVNAYAEGDSCGFAVATDIHYVHPLPNAEDCVEAEIFSMNKDGNYYQHESGFIIDEFLRQCAGDGECDFILISGDLATYGREYVEDHYTLAQKFRNFERTTGKQVYVINGNHDNGSGTLTDSAKFREIYGEFGYDEAFAVDESCCSYAVNLNDKYGLIAFDSCHEDYHLANGVDSDRINWVKKQAKAITDSGRYPIMMMHHNLLEHMPLQLITQDKYIVSYPKTYASVLADCGIKLVFTGHTHMGDAVSHTSPMGNVIYDFCTPALSQYPMQYRRFTLTDEEISYEMKTVEKIDTVALSAVVSGYSEERLNEMATDFPGYAGERLKNRTLDSIKEMISAKGLGISEINPLYGFVDRACKSVDRVFAMPLYGENGVQQLARENGIDIPDSEYETIWDMIGDVSLEYTVGNKSYGCDSTEVRILLGGAEIALNGITGGETDSYISSAVEAITENNAGFEAKAAEFGAATPESRFALSIISVAAEAFCNDNDGVNNISGTVSGYGAPTSGFSNILSALTAFYEKLVKYMTMVFDAFVY